MFYEIANIIIRSAEDSFLQVTVFVGVALLLFGYLNYKTQGQLVLTIQKNKNWQPVIGALLGLTPGCGGAIFVMPLFLNGNVSFGTVVATLIATSGDSAFVVISSLPLHFIVISAISFFAAVVSGYLIDYFKLGDRLGLTRKKSLPVEELEKHYKETDHTTQNLVCTSIEGCKEKHLKHIGHEEGDELDLVLHHKMKGLQNPLTLVNKLVHAGSLVYWLFIAIGLILGIMLLFQIDVYHLAVPHIGLMIGVVGTLFSILLVLGEHKYIGDDTLEESELKLMSLKETFIHNAHETAFAGTWVFAAFFIYELLVLGAGKGDYVQGEIVMQNFMASVGLIAVITGAIVGLVPGCGMQILYVSLFIKGLLPFAALVANAISQDGDALFPLIAMDKKSSLWASIITTIPALVIGLMLYYIETKTGIFDVLKVAIQYVTTLVFC